MRTKKKVLIVAHMARFLLQFEKRNVELLQALGFEVHYASNFKAEEMIIDAKQRILEMGVRVHQVDFVRSPFLLPQNIKAYHQLIQVMRQEEFYAVHCHTPMGGVLARLAANRLGIAPVIYTAHGFHFFKQGPLVNKVCFKPVEWFLSRYTDALVTMNEEDFLAACRFPARGKVYKTHGVGVDISRFSFKENVSLKEKFGLPEDAMTFLSIGELIPRKNHLSVILALKNLPENVYYLIAGSGRLERELKDEARFLGVRDRVRFLGYRSDIAHILHGVDCFIFPSLQEGLPVALMEALASGVPCLASKIRGNVDLMGKHSPWLFEPMNLPKIEYLMKRMIEMKEQGEKIVPHSIEDFDISRTQEEMLKIYRSVLLRDKS